MTTEDKVCASAQTLHLVETAGTFVLVLSTARPEFFSAVTQWYFFSSCTVGGATLLHLQPAPLTISIITFDYIDHHIRLHRSSPMDLQKDFSESIDRYHHVTDRQDRKRMRISYQPTMMRRSPPYDHQLLSQEPDLSTIRKELWRSHQHLSKCDIDNNSPSSEDESIFLAVDDRDDATHDVASSAADHIDDNWEERFSVYHHLRWSIHTSSWPFTTSKP